MPVATAEIDGLMSRNIYKDVFMKRYKDSYDMNDISLPSGIYGIHFDYSIKNNTTGFSLGSLIIINGTGLSHGGDPICQLAISNNGTIRYRIYWFGDWSLWKQITTSSVA